MFDSLDTLRHCYEVGENFAYLENGELVRLVCRTPAGVRCMAMGRLTGDGEVAPPLFTCDGVPLFVDWPGDTVATPVEVIGERYEGGGVSAFYLVNQDICHLTSDGTMYRLFLTGGYAGYVDYVENVEPCLVRVVLTRSETGEQFASFVGERE